MTTFTNITNTIDAAMGEAIIPAQEVMPDWVHYIEVALRENQDGELRLSVWTINGEGVEVDSTVALIDEALEDIDEDLVYIFAFTKMGYELEPGRPFAKFVNPNA